MGGGNASSFILSKNTPAQQIHGQVTLHLSTTIQENGGKFTQFSIRNELHNAADLLPSVGKELGKRNRNEAGRTHKPL